MLIIYLFIYLISVQYVHQDFKFQEIVVIIKHLA